MSVVTASAESLNTAYTDLYHRVAGTDGMNIVKLAQAFGVNTTASGLGTMRSEVGTALGQASLTVGEQASTFSTLANNGEYVTPHVVLQIQVQKPNALMQTINAKVTRRMVLTPAEDSDVDYALSFDTKPGGTAATAGLPDGREIIAKTGTTNLSQSAFFIGSIPQFTLAVGMFTNQQGCPTKRARLRERVGQFGRRAAGRHPDPVRAGWPAGLRRPGAGLHLARLRDERIRPDADAELPDAGLRRHRMEPARAERAQAGQGAPDAAADRHLPGLLLRPALPPEQRQWRQSHPGAHAARHRGDGDPDSYDQVARRQAVRERIGGLRPPGRSETVYRIGAW